MPCQSYESSWANDHNDEKIKRLKAEADKLARIACKALTALEEMEKQDFLLLKDDEVAEWWNAHKEADRKEQARLAEIERKERIKAEALARLSDEEKELLGLKKPSAKVAKKHTKRSGRPLQPSDLTEVWEEYDITELVKKLNKPWDL